MSINVGEELVAEYLRYIEKCDFVEKNVPFPDQQGEIDVFGINLIDKKVYICEVAIHIRGLQYVKRKGSGVDNKQRIINKFLRDIDFAKEYFADYEAVFMFWSPVVSKKSKNQWTQLQEAVEEIKQKRSIDIELVINEHFCKKIEKLRDYARGQTNEIKTPITRFLQIEEHIKKRIKNKGGKSCE